MAFEPVDVAGDRFDMGLLPWQQTPQQTQLRRLIELRQALVDKMTAGGPVPRSTGGGQSTPMQAGTRAGLERFTQSITGLPDLAATTLMSIPNKIARDAQNFGNLPELMGYQRAESGPLPGIGERVLPGVPDAADVFAGAQRLGESAAALKTGDFSQFRPDARGQQQLISEEMAQQQPMATQIGTIAGDVATLGLLRSPVARTRSLQEMGAIETRAALDAAHKAAIDAGKLPGFRAAPTFSDAIKSATSGSSGFASLANRAGRAAETGIEGAVLGILTEGDPLEMAAYSAGSQAAGSLALGALGGLFSGGPMKAGTKLALSAVAVTGLLQTAKSVAPGGQDYILPTIQQAFNKVALGVAAGALAGVAGFGRMPVKSLPAISDALSSIPRAATLSVLNDALNDTRAEKVINQISSDPNYFGPVAARRLERAFRNPNISISSVIDDLMETKVFREKYNELEKAK